MNAAPTEKLTRLLSVQELIAHVEGSIDAARRGESLMSDDVLAIRGFSTPAQRRLVNNLCRMPGGATYLEVGLYAGATFCGAMSNNPELTAIGIDDHSQNFCVENVWDELAANLEKFKGDPRSMKFHNASSWDVAPDIKGPVDIFYFDGEHGEPSQAKALPAFVHALAHRFILKIDDTDWPQVRSGTEKGFAAVADKVKVEYKWRLSEGRPDGELWHNGIDIFVCSKI